MKTSRLSILALVAVQVHAAGVEVDELRVSAEAAELAGGIAPPVSAENLGFVGKLTAEEKAVAGLEKLSATEIAALNSQVASEVRLALQGDVRGFAGTFISRRTPDERTAAGLGGLTTGEKYQLDRLVSRALASTPPQPPLAITRPATESDLFTKPFKWETHGFVQLEYGFGSGGRDYKAATVAVTQENPRTGTAFTFAYTAAEGDLYWCRGWGAGWRQRVW